MPDSVPLREYAVHWHIPKDVCGQDVTAIIGGDPYRLSSGTRKGYFAVKSYGDLNTMALDYDLTWSKYGEAWDTPEEAFHALMTTRHKGPGRQ